MKSRSTRFRRFMNSDGMRSFDFRLHLQNTGTRLKEDNGNCQDIDSGAGNPAAVAYSDGSIPAVCAANRIRSYTISTAIRKWLLCSQKMQNQKEYSVSPTNET
jgi:hypothetical protein